MSGRHWLLARDVDRQRLLDMDRRLKPIREATFVLIAVAFLAAIPWVGWEIMPLLLVAAILFRLGDGRAEGSSRPEYWIFGAWVGAQVMIALATLLLNEPGLTAIWFALPIVTLSARFSAPGVVTGVAITIALMVGVTLAVDAQGVLDYPPLLLGPVVVVIGIAYLSTALMQSDLQYRKDSVVDPLTGLLNRKALDNRIEELHQQSLNADGPIGLVCGDLDHFKAVNDAVGHPAGDQVLKETAEIIRGQLRAFELAYRIGGEEFLVLLPGLDLAQTTKLAERLRTAVGGHPFSHDVRLTMSCGVSASHASPTLDFKAFLSSVDEALYEAKRAGRDQVCIAGAKDARERLLSDPVPDPRSVGAV